MNKKMFIIIIFVIIFGVFVFVPVKEILIHLGITNFYKGDNWKIVEKSNSKIKDKVMSLETNIENRYNNYFPFYEKINSVFYNTIVTIDGLYLDDIYLKDNNDLDHLFYDKNNGLFYLTNHYSNKELDNRLNEQVEFYNDIKNKYPSVDLAIYIPLRYSETKNKNVFDINSKMYNFNSKLDSRIKRTVLDISDYTKYFYKTDHHFNSYGAEVVYHDVLRMFNLQNILNIIHKDVKEPYYGSMAKSVLQDYVSDKLTAIDTKTILGVNIHDELFKPLKIDDKSNKFYDYYVGYFNEQYDEIIYTNKSNYNRNLLIIGDSLAWQIDYLLAANFDKTFVVNMKYGKWKTNNLELSSYIEKNHITHILFLREAKNIVFDADNFNLAKRVVR